MRRFLIVVLSLALGGFATAKDPNLILRQILDNPKPTVQEIKVVPWLLHHGASFKNVSKRGITTVMFATRFEDVRLLKQAIKAGVDVNAHTKDWKWTALMGVGLRADMVSVLLDAGADPNARDYVGRTPLMWAAESKSRAAIELLLSHGANASLKNVKGYTAVVYAAGSPRLQKLLRDHGA